MSQEPSSMPERSWWDRAICAARSGFYRTEGLRLRWARDAAPEIRAPAVVSVLIPTFNRADLLLSRALPSVLAQTYPHLQAVVAAHGCTDGTQERVKALKDPRVHLLNVPRSRSYPPNARNHWLAGPVVPLNAALDRATGDWLARIDDDDIWHKHHLESALDHLRAHDWEFVSFAHKTHEGAAKPYKVGAARASKWVGGTQTWVWRSYLRFMRWNPDCWRKRYDAVNDTDLQARFVRAGVRMGYLDEIHARVLPRPGETQIGLKAYQENRAATERRFSFS